MSLSEETPEVDFETGSIGIPLTSEAAKWVTDLIHTHSAGKGTKIRTPIKTSLNDIFASKQFSGTIEGKLVKRVKDTKGTRYGFYPDEDNIIYSPKTAKSYHKSPRNFFDKVELKRFSIDTGIFLNARYIDVRDISHWSLLTLNIRSFTDFPYDLVISNPGTYLFHNQEDGFKITNKERSIFITSKNKTLQKIIQKVGEISDPYKKINQFLTTLVDIHFSFETLGRYDEQKIADSLLKHDGNLYLKTALGANGTQVISLRKDCEGTKVIECDSDWLSNNVKSRNGREVISAILHKMYLPFIEEEIPYISVDGQRIELRYFYRKEENKFEVYEFGSKESKNRTTANYCLGGCLTTIEKSLDKIYRSFGYSDSWRKVEEKRSEFLELNKRFSEKLFPYLEPNHDYQALNIDFIPTWKEGDIQLYFLEINPVGRLF